MLKTFSRVPEGEKQGGGNKLSWYLEETTTTFRVCAQCK